MCLRRRTRRRGFTVLEVIVTMILLGAVLGVMVPLTKRATEQRRLSETRRAALLEASNALERLAADPAAAPAAGEERTVPLPETLSRRLPDAALVVRGEAQTDPPGRRLDASLSWTEPNGRRATPVRLSAFVFDAPARRGGGR
jgi:prepilin-type N-terminal cleavage/methylation domain-containing protein